MPPSRYGCFRAVFVEPAERVHDPRDESAPFLGGSPADAIGQKIVLNKRQLTVIGVAPRDFTGTHVDATDVWVPLGMLSQLSPMGRQGSGPLWYQARWLFGFQIIARPSAPNDGPLAAARYQARRYGASEAKVNARRSW